MPCSVWDDDEPHGVAVAEVVQDMAPDAELFLVRAETASDLHAGIEWLAAEGVTVVTRSLTSPFDGPGDGTGPMATVIDEAVAAGMTFVQAAGNSAGQASASPPRPGSYLRWTFADADGDGLVEFAPGDERLTVDCGYLNGLRWDDFDDGVDTTDYDLHVYNGSGTVLQDSSTDDQGAGAPPIERTDDCTTSRNQIAVELLGDPGQPGAQGDVLELMMNGVGFERWTNAGSASGPAADTANPGALTVGAVSPWNGTNVAYYSSRGPTNDGRRKPDLAAASCFASVITTPSCFGGTSASAPVVAGAAALRSEDSPSSDPAMVAAWLLEEATVDRGVVGPDNAAGAGELILPRMGPRPRYRPDARIARSEHGTLIGNGIYNRTGVGQSITTGSFSGSSVTFTVLLENDGNAPERFAVGGSRGVGGFTTTYTRPSSAGVPTRGITGPVTRGEYFTEVVRPGRSTRIKVTVRIPTQSPARAIRGVLQVYSYANFTTTDLVAFTIERY